MQDGNATIGDVLTYISGAKAAGVADATIVALLRNSGWSERRAYAALSAYYGSTIGAPPSGRSGRDAAPRDAFYYLLSFITLGFWTIALGQLLYVLIANQFPDRSDPRYLYSQGLMTQISWQLATVIIAFPTFLFIGRLIGEELKRRPDAAASMVRAWLTYVALVIAALVALADGIWFLSAMLQGELTVRFFLDSLVLLALSGGVFAYYLTTLRTAQAE